MLKNVNKGRKNRSFRRKLHKKPDKLRKIIRQRENKSDKQVNTVMEEDKAANKKKKGGSYRDKDEDIGDVLEAD